MAACVMMQFNKKVPGRCNVEFVELFSGEGAISAHLRAAGLSGSSHDLSYAESYDLTKTTGFLHLGWVFFHVVRLEAGAE